MQQHPSLDLLTFAEPYLLDADSTSGPPKHSLAELRWLTGRKLKFGVEVTLVEASPSRPFDLLARHLRAARLGRERRANRILVLEGDVDIDRRWRFQEPGVLAHLATLDWDIVDLGYRDQPDRSSPDSDVEGQVENEFPSPIVRSRDDIDGGWAYLLHGYFLETWITHLEESIASRASAPTAGEALNAITAANPLTMRYRIDPPLAIPALPTPGAQSGGLLLTRALFRRGSRRQQVDG